MGSLAGLQGRVIAMRLGDTAPRLAGSRFSGGRGRQQPSRHPWHALNPAALTDESAARPDSIVVLGRDNPAVARLFSGVVLPQADFALSVAPHPYDPSRLVALVHAASEEAVRAAVQALPNLWCLTAVAMREGRVIVRGEAEMPRGIRAHEL